MPSEITHKSQFRLGPYLGLLIAAWVFGYVVGVNDTASANQPPTVPEPAHTVHITPTR